MDLCTGGELLDRISEYGSLSEDIAANIFKQMVESVSYCNAVGVCHRDLTPKSFMFLRNDKDSPLILIDLGISKLVNNSTLLNLIHRKKGTIIDTIKRRCKLPI